MNIQVQSFLNQIKSLLLILLFVLATKVSVQAEDAHAKAGVESEFIPAEMIVHHISDSHEWHIATIGHDHYTIPLPVILYFEIDGKSGWDFFMSSQFHAEGFDLEGERNESLPVDGGFKIDHHGHIYYEKDGKPFGPAKIIDLSITKNAASIFISMVLLLVVFLAVARGFVTNKGKAPKGIQSFFEPIIVFVRDEIALPNIGEHKYMKFMPYLLTVFFFIWFNNLLGLLPSGANASGNIAVTMTLAVLTALITNFSGNKDYWMHILWTPGVPLPLRIIMLPVELIGIITKPFALMIRLFANITAGHIIILSIMSFIFIFKSLGVAAVSVPFAVVMNVMEFGVAALQAYIFTLLSALFIGSAVAVHAHDDHH
jgi:F-type H+-transporting ATPase subunit a